MGDGRKADDVSDVTQLIHRLEPTRWSLRRLIEKILPVVNSQVVLGYSDLSQRFTMGSHPLLGNEVRHRPHRSIGGRGIPIDRIGVFKEVSGVKDVMPIHHHWISSCINSNL